MLSLSKVTPITNASFLTLQQCALAVGIGGDAQGFPCFAEIPVANMTDEVPLSFPNRTYSELIDPEDPDSDLVETAYTWETWYPNHKPTKEIDGFKYKALATSWDYIHASQWVPAWTGGLSIKTEAEYKVITQTQDTP